MTSKWYSPQLLMKESAFIIQKSTGLNETLSDYQKMGNSMIGRLVENSTLSDMIILAKQYQKDITHLCMQIDKILKENSLTKIQKRILRAERHKLVNCSNDLATNTIHLQDLIDIYQLKISAPQTTSGIMHTKIEIETEETEADELIAEKNIPDLNGLEEQIRLKIYADHIFSRNPLHYKPENGEAIETLEDLYNHLNRLEKESFEQPDRSAVPIISHEGFSEKTGIAFAEAQGRRPEQQDRIAYGSISEFAKLTDEERKLTLVKTAVSLEAMLEELKIKNSGSTFCASIVCENKVYTVNVGDSTSHLICINHEGKSVYFTRLNKVLHTPDERSEIDRLIKAGKEEYITRNTFFSTRYNKNIFIFRLGGLAMTRAMGDMEYEEKGVIHKADCYVDNINIPKNGKAYIVVACDGLTESIAESRKEGEENVSPSMEILIEKYSPLGSIELAKMLATTAYNRKSGDNISVIILPVIPDLKTPIYAAIFDGHGNPDCADFLRENLHSTFIKNIRDQLKSRRSTDTNND